MRRGLCAICAITRVAGSHGLAPLVTRPLVRPASMASMSSTAAGLSDVAADGGAPSDPVDTMVVPWRERIDGSIARSRKVRGGNFVQIATVDQEGRPHARTVVFRGFETLDGRDSMKMITDARSSKCSEIRATPACEMVWWFSKSSEQYRIAGELELIGDEAEGERRAARKQQWGNLSDKAREQFYWHQPGAGFSGEPAVPAAGRGSDGKVLEPPPEFLLMLLHPGRVHYLRLTDNFAQADEAAEGGWSAVRVNP